MDAGCGLAQNKAMGTAIIEEDWRIEYRMKCVAHGRAVYSTALSTWT